MENLSENRYVQTTRSTDNPKPEILPFPISQHIMTEKYLKGQKTHFENEVFSLNSPGVKG